MHASTFWLWHGRTADTIQILGSMLLALPAAGVWTGDWSTVAWVVVIGLVVFGAVWMVLRMLRHREFSRRRKARLLLSRLDWAVKDLLNGTQPDNESLRRDLFRWQESLLRLMDALGCTETDKSKIAVLVTFQRDGLAGRDDEHALLRDIVSEKVKRLRELAARMEGHTS